MPLTDAGAIVIASALLGDGLVPILNNANAFLGVGDSTTVFSKAHTDLQAASNKLRKVMDSTYPQRSGAVLTFRSTFSTGEANFAWQEWGAFNASSGGSMFSRKVESLGTKTSAQSWQLTATGTVAA
jgi:hypothetical protein